MIEHENDIERLEYTLNKFDEVSAPLKVSIFYVDEEKEKEYLEKSRQIILKQTPSYPGEVYLLIFGVLVVDKKEIIWSGYEIDAKGKTVALHLEKSE